MTKLRGRINVDYASDLLLELNNVEMLLVGRKTALGKTNVSNVVKWLENFGVIKLINDFDLIKAKLSDEGIKMVKACGCDKEKLKLLLSTAKKLIPKRKGSVGWNQH